MTGDGGGGRAPGHLVDTLAGSRVLVVGDAMLDRYMRGDVERVSPEAPVPVVRLREAEETPGGAGNVAAGVAALGGECRLIAAVGDDDPGRTLRRLLEEAGVDAAGLVEVGDRPTTVKTRIIGRGQQMLRVDRETRARLDERAAGRVRRAIRAAVADVDAVALADYGKGMLGEAEIRQATDAAADRGIPVIADPSRSRLQQFRGAHVLTPNRSEAGRAVPSGGDGGPLGSEALLELRRRAGARYLLVTLGGNGMCLVGPDGTVRRIPAEKAEVYDVTGAGDTVAAVLAAALSRGVAVGDAARLANQAAALEVQKLGARPVSLEELGTAAG